MHVCVFVCSWIHAIMPYTVEELFEHATLQAIICVWIWMCISAYVSVCVFMHVLHSSTFTFGGVYMKEEITAGFQTRLLPEPQRKLNESGCKIYSLFDFHLLTLATESPTITGSAQVPLAHGYKCTITPAYHFNADVPGRSPFQRRSQTEYNVSQNWSSCLLFPFFL